MVRRKRKKYDEMGEITKGPWKVEEDEVLINHVNKYGPRDWTSLRSKGLLYRTGKSCRLRWVNKLRPDLKTGVKFSAEEERTVIDLQAQFRNKWAKIATHLPGRTDNDVKNFWSSRQKRLARILQTSTPSSSSKSTNQPPITNLISPLEVPKLSSSMEMETVHEAIKIEPFSFPQIPQLQPEFPLLLESQDFITRHGDPSFLDEFPIVPSFLEPQGTCSNTKTVESVVDDFPPLEIYDHIEPLPSPSEWS